MVLRELFHIVKNFLQISDNPLEFIISLIKPMFKVIEQPKPFYLIT